MNAKKIRRDSYSKALRKRLLSPAHRFETQAGPTQDELNSSQADGLRRYKDKQRKHP